MPYLVTTSIYPGEKATEVGAKYLEALTKYPPDESIGTIIIPAAVKSTHEGIKTFGVSDILEGKLDVAMSRSANMMAMFRDISGFSYTIDVYLKVEEAMSTIGMEMP